MELKNKRKRQILDLCKTCLDCYTNILNIEELEIIKDVLNNIDNLDYETLSTILSPLVRKIWDVELASNKYNVVSWNKYGGEKRTREVTFATIFEKDNIKTFCDMKYGMQYKISYDALIGALDKDGATMIEDIDKKNAYTIGVINNKVINSYNGATKLITPIQLVRENINNDYKSKHNELILNTSKIEEIGPFVLDDCPKSL